MTGETLNTRTKSRKRRMEKALKVGESVNPDNLRYLDNQGMVNEETSGGLWSSEFKAFLHAQTLKALFYSEDWVYITVDSIALPISQCPIVVFQYERSDDGKDRENALEDHPISKMFATPNPYQSGVELAYSFAVDFILGGNGFLYQPTNLQQVFNMPFERVSYDFDSQGLPQHVTFYNQQQDDIILPGAAAKNIPLDQAIHSRRPNPSSAFWGLSPFTPGRKSVLTNRYTQDYILSFYLKGATPQMILEMENNASQKSLVRMIRSFEAAYTGRRNQRRTMVLPKGVKATVADTKIVDQQFIDLVKQNREVVLNILRVPKHALGLQESGSLGSREHDLALRWFWDQTIKPSMNMMGDALTRHFRKRGAITEQQYVGFDTSEIRYTSDDLLQLSETSNALEKSWTLNERRDRLFALPPLPDGDVVIGIPQPVTPMPFSLGEPEPVVEIPTTTAMPEAEVVAPEEPKSRIEGIRSKYAGKLRAADEAMTGETKKQENKMTLLAADLLADQAIACVSEFKAMARTREEINQKEWKKRTKKAIDKLKKSYANDYAKTLESTVDAGYTAQVGMMFDDKSAEALAAFKETDVKGQRLVLKERGVFQFASSRDTTVNRVAKVIETGLAKGLSVDKVADGIVQYMKDEARWRANMIARTETLTAFSVGSNATIKRASEVIPKMKKMWVTAMDERVRDDHQAMEGVTVEADKDFKLPDGSTGYGPRSPGLSAGQSINCFVGQTEFSAKGIKASLSHFYEGEFFTIKTLGGKSLCGTGNHPVLTDGGWKPLHLLNKGDKLVCAKVNLASVVDVDVNHVNTKAEEIHNSLRKSFVSERVSRVVVDFHGDVPTGDVDVVSTNSRLQFAVNPPTLESAENLGLPSADVTLGFGLPNGPAEKLCIADNSSSASLVTRSDLSSSSVRAHSGPLDALGFASSSGGNAEFQKPVTHNYALKTHSLSDVVLRSEFINVKTDKSVSVDLNPGDFGSVSEISNSYSSSDKTPANGLIVNAKTFGDTILGPEFVDVEMDDVVDVEVNYEAHNVYNLHTESEMYTANGILVHNCRCVVLMLPPEDVGDYAEEVENMPKDYDK